MLEALLRRFRRSRDRPSPLPEPQTPAERGDLQAQRWQEKWTRPDFEAPWLGRGISREIIQAVEEGWFPAGGAALDIGCGEGEVAAWLAAHGFPSVGIDIAPAAIARAEEKNRACPGDLKFFASDICAAPPPGADYKILIDRGCLHLIDPEDHPAYWRNVAAVSAPNARLLLLMRAFRKGQPIGDPAETERIKSTVERGAATSFKILRLEPTYLDPFGGAKPDRALPGIVLWMQRASLDPRPSDAR